ncbi:hypothetical protein Goarm_000861 [Gossypium armourianum]|uniref:Uncharacterized protein n=1 Tax=Gossypium armourianum TaxID=34283 RepID=A0A7J9KB62_9ROSI|nr:hypothetical protein [Gossypium armourianum]
MIETLPMVEFTMDVNYSRLNSGVGRSTKKVRTRSDLPPESEDPTVDRNGQKIQGFDLPKVSYKSTLIGASSEHSIARTIIVKLLGKNIGFNALLNTVSHMLPGLLERFYSSCLLKEIGQTFGSVVKLDIHTDYACRGCFARLAVCVDLRKSLVSEVRINGQLQRVEYESLPDVCFKCECYGHVRIWVQGPKFNRRTKTLKGRGRFSGAARNDGVDGGYGGSQFAALGRDEDEIHGVINGKDDVRAFGGNEGVIFGEGNGRKNIEQFGEIKNQEKAIRMVENFGFKKSNGFSKNLKLG